MVEHRRWPVIAAVLVGALIVAGIGWVAGRSSAPEGSAQAQSADDRRSAVRLVDGVPVGVEHTRAGSLAAADNYVAIGSETLLQDPPRYARLVREAYAASYQPLGDQRGTRGASADDEPRGRNTPPDARAWRSSPLVALTATSATRRM